MIKSNWICRKQPKKMQEDRNKGSDNKKWVEHYVWTVSVDPLRQKAEKWVDTMYKSKQRTYFQ